MKLALIVEGIVSEVWLPSSGNPPEGASNLYLDVDCSYLKPYGIKCGDKLIGTIEEVRPSKYESPIEELANKSLTFIVGEVRGRIFISSKDFEDIFREYGLVKEGFTLKVKFTEAVVNNSRIQIYTKRDVKYTG